MSHRRRIITAADRRRLGRVLASDTGHPITRPGLKDDLEWKLENAASTESETVPPDVITMNSTVLLVDQRNGTRTVCTIAYPEDVDIVTNGISVLSAVGSALLGCRVGDMVEEGDAAHRRRWRVAEILYQPERVGAFHL